MLPEGEDLLQQLSGELGIPEFLEDLPMLEDTELNAPNSIYDSLMNDAVFEDLTQVIDNKTYEPQNFTSINFNAFPPSPSNSDSSSSNSVVDSKDGILSPATSEMSPPVSPPAMGTSIVSVPDLSNVKIPIPKIQKPSKKKKIYLF